MNLNAKLTLDGLIRALRWQGLQKADLHRTRDLMAGEFEPAGAAASPTDQRLVKDRKP
jgi:hypothetical protein